MGEKWIVEFQNPAFPAHADPVRSEFDTEAEARTRVEHYALKYGAFPAYEDAEVIPPESYHADRSPEP